MISFIWHSYKDKNIGAVTDQRLPGAGEGEEGWQQTDMKISHVIEIDLHILVVMRHDCLHVSKLTELYPKMKEILLISTYVIIL